jgi:hypothetical protein
VLGTVTEIRNGACKTTSEIDDRNQLEKRFISSQAFHRTTGGRVQKITTREQFESQNLEIFNPAAQENDWGFTCNNPHKNQQKFAPNLSPFLKTDGKSQEHSFGAHTSSLSWRWKQKTQPARTDRSRERPVTEK